MFLIIWNNAHDSTIAVSIASPLWRIFKIARTYKSCTFARTRFPTSVKFVGCEIWPSWRICGWKRIPAAIQLSLICKFHLRQFSSTWVPTHLNVSFHFHVIPSIQGCNWHVLLVNLCRRRDWKLSSIVDIAPRSSETCLSCKSSTMWLCNQTKLPNRCVVVSSSFILMIKMNPYLTPTMRHLGPHLTNNSRPSRYVYYKEYCTKNFCLSVKLSAWAFPSYAWCTADKSMHNSDFLHSLLLSSLQFQVEAATAPVGEVVRL